MEKSKLVQLLQAFSRAELRELARFLANPAFNARPEAVPLLEILAKTGLSGKPWPDKEKVFAAVFPRLAFDDHRLRLAMSALLVGAEKYLAVNDFLQDTPAFQSRLSRILRSRGIPRAASQALSDGAMALDQQVVRNAEYQFDLFRFQEEQFRLLLETPEAAQAGPQALSDQLDAALLAFKFRQACSLWAYQSRYNVPCNFQFVEQLLPQAERFMHLPAVAMYYHCFRALTTAGDTQHFQTFKQDLLARGELFPPEELRDLFILAINFCTRRYNEGDHAFLPDHFDLYRIGFSRNYFLSEGILSRFTYLNAATIGLVMQEYAWTEQLIREQKARLEPAFRESVHAFNLARLEYHKKNYGTALQLLQRAEYKETMMALAAKTIQLKIYYETEELDLLESHLQAITAYIRRKKVIGYQRENYLNLVYFVRKLLEVNPLDKKQKQQLRDNIQQTRPLAEKEWLLLMID
ncbi:MAG: hypothetical protein IT261_10960 [Saprospiraceae bacterium]|nr:hypothetical protein [Saprospiraceae bacterium]